MKFLPVLTDATRIIEIRRLFINSIPSYLASVIFSILSTILVALAPLIVGILIDNLASLEWRRVTWLLALLVISQITSGLLQSLAARISAVRGEEISHDFRTVLSEAIFSYHKNYNSIAGTSRGQLLSIFSRDIEALWDLLGFAITETISSLVMLLSLGTLVFFISPSVGMIFALIAIIFSFSYIYNGNRVRKLFAIAAPKFDNMLNLINSLVDGYETIAAFKRQNWAVSSITKLSQEVTSLSSNAHKRSTNFSLITGTINTFGVLGVWVVALLGISSGSSSAMSVGELVTILFYFTMLTGPLETLGGTAKAINKGIVSLNRIVDFYDKIKGSESHKSVETEKEICRPNNTSVREAILTAREAVDHTGTSVKSILAPVSLELAPGEIMGVAGASGSGKSTLLKLFARIIPSNEAGIFLEGVSYDSISETDFREKVIYIQQRPAIFPTNLEQNLFVNKIDSDILKSLNSLNISELVPSLSNSDDISNVGLSGGEMQRLAISRIFRKTPRVVLIDEPTSALDFNNGRNVCNALITVVNKFDGAAIVASHDPYILSKCSYVALMKDGKIVENSTFDKLRRESKLFSQVIENSYGERSDIC